MMRGLADFRQRILSLIHRLRIWCACRSRRGVTTGGMWEKHRRGEPSKPKALTLIEFQEGGIFGANGVQCFRKCPLIYCIHIALIMTATSEETVSLRRLLLFANHYSLEFLFTIYSLYFKDDRSCSIVAAGNHNLIILRPAMHDASTLQSRINITADSIPSLRTERNTFCSAMHRSRRLQTTLIRFAGFHKCSRTHVPEVVPLIVAVKQKLITHIIAGAFAAVRYGAVFLL